MKKFIIHSTLQAGNVYTGWIPDRDEFGDLPKQPHSVLINPGCVTEIDEDELKMLREIPTFLKHRKNGFIKIEVLDSQETVISDTGKTKAPESRYTVQDKRILEIIRGLGYDPQSLPKNESGKPGVKADVMKESLKDAKLFTKWSFLHAWKRYSHQKKYK